MVEKEPVKLNLSPSSPKRSHGGQGSTLPWGSLKLLISFSYSNDFLHFFSVLPSTSHLPRLPSLLKLWKFPLGNRGHSSELYDCRALLLLIFYNYFWPYNSI